MIFCVEIQARKLSPMHAYWYMSSLSFTPAIWEKPESIADPFDYDWIGVEVFFGIILPGKVVLKLEFSTDELWIILNCSSLRFAESVGSLSINSFYGKSLVIVSFHLF